MIDIGDGLGRAILIVYFIHSIIFIGKLLLTFLVIFIFYKIAKAVQGSVKNKKYSEYSLIGSIILGALVSLLFIFGVKPYELVTSAISKNNFEQTMKRQYELRSVRYIGNNSIEILISVPRTDIYMIKYSLERPIEVSVSEYILQTQELRPQRLVAGGNIINLQFAPIDPKITSIDVGLNIAPKSPQAYLYTKQERPGYAETLNGWIIYNEGAGYESDRFQRGDCADAYRPQVPCFFESKLHINIQK